MKTKQRNIRVFEIECESADDVRSYVTKNRALIEGLTLFLKGPVAESCVEVCKELGLCYAVAGECDSSKTATKKSSKSVESKDLFSAGGEESMEMAAPVQERTIEKIVEKVVERIVYVDKVVEKEPQTASGKTQRIIKNSTMRSGEDVVTDGDVSVFARVNSGAKIKADGCVELFDTVDGFVECNGEYMLIKSIGKGTVIFAGVKLDSAAFGGKLKKVSMVDGKIEIKEV